MNNEIIYHYTDMNACMSILENQELWLTAHPYMNDEHEFLHGFELIESTLSNELQKTDNEEVKAFVAVFMQLVSESLMFSTSFSKEGDLLSQWRSYCPKEGGISIGFDRAILEKSYSGYSSKSNRVKLVDCCYDDDHSKEIANTFSIVLSNTAPNGYARENPILDRDQIPSTYLGIIGHLARTKNPSFQEEKEVRLYTYGNMDNVPFIIDGVPKPNDSGYLQMPITVVHQNVVEFRSRNGVLVPYITQSFPIEAIKEIRLAPSKYQDLNVDSLKMYLKSKKLHRIKIVASNIPYRTF
ncbi:DUF2971 domain-containing protein [Thiomicrorhabdus sediminis]|uniref:DUF2971 domain-containing protein n=1 Tax=Thiomicrorhabdus sediminis TaxID=2580412 RepID=A0A4P9K6Q2_9GAMM|nr:DUF2971 domain-containing protein [Thiomicrorhabdus sediminis]QCU90551.1 DUF2971 domain-containing protein [Thiomicrorhabdus sediminis]